jgi:ribokinase
MSRVIVVGSVNEDQLVRAPIPAPGETVAARGAIVLLPGGKGANAACAAARLATPTWLVGAVGADAAGDRALAALRAAGVAVERVAVRDDAATGQAIVVVDDAGENAIVIAAGANGRLERATVERDVAALAVRCGVVLSGLEVPLEAVAAAARAATVHGLRFVLDPAPAQPLPPALIPPGAVIVPNAHELVQLGTSPDGLLAAGAGAVVVTRGADGADIHLRAGEPPLTIPAPGVGAVDTTGAGDAFRGALAAALAEGDELVDAVGLAVVAGACATTASGARGALADRAAIAALTDG